MIFHRKVTRCDRKRNATSVIKKKSPWTFGGYNDIHSDRHAPTQSQPFQNSTVGLSNVFWIPLWIPGLKFFSHLRHYFRFLVELWPVRTKLRTPDTSISFPPRPLLASSSRYVCHVIEQGVVLVCRYWHNFHICWGSPGTSFWLKMFSHFLVTFVS